MTISRVPACRRRFLLSVNANHGIALLKGCADDNFVDIVAVVGTGVLVRSDGDVLGPVEDKRGFQIRGCRLQTVELRITAINPGPTGQPQGRGPEKE